MPFTSVAFTCKLETAGVAVRSEAADVPLSPAQESVVAMVVREAVTNIVRHARARNCQLRLAPVDGSCLLEVLDDGQGGHQVEGNGLRGMRERIEALGGTLARETSTGTRLTSGRSQRGGSLSTERCAGFSISAKTGRGVPWK